MLKLSNRKIYQKWSEHTNIEITFAEYLECLAKQDRSDFPDPSWNKPVQKSVWDDPIPQWVRLLQTYHHAMRVGFDLATNGAEDKTGTDCPQESGKLGTIGS